MFLERHTFFQEYLISGILPNFNQKRTRDVLLSKTIMDRLQLQLNDTINVTFFKNQNKGFYVDDRSIRPSEFINMTKEEIDVLLLNK